MACPLEHPGEKILIGSEAYEACSVDVNRNWIRQDIRCMCNFDNICLYFDFVLDGGMRMPSPPTINSTSPLSILARVSTNRRQSINQLLIYQSNKLSEFYLQKVLSYNSSHNHLLNYPLSPTVSICRKPFSYFVVVLGSLLQHSWILPRKHQQLFGKISLALL